MMTTSMTTAETSPLVPRLRVRRGFTMVEVIVASLILGAALLAMAGFSVRYQKGDSMARIMNRAQQAANERLEQVRNSRPYLSLDSMATTESSIPTYPGYQRITSVTRVGGTATDTLDYKIITVKVKTPGVERWATKSSIVGAF